MRFLTCSFRLYVVEEEHCLNIDQFFNFIVSIFFHGLNKNAVIGKSLEDLISQQRRISRTFSVHTHPLFSFLENSCDIPELVDTIFQSLQNKGKEKIIAALKSHFAKENPLFHDVKTALAEIDLCGNTVNIRYACSSLQLF